MREFFGDWRTSEGQDWSLVFTFKGKCLLDGFVYVKCYCPLSSVLHTCEFRPGLSVVSIVSPVESSLSERHIVKCRLRRIKCRFAYGWKGRLSKLRRAMVQGPSLVGSQH